MNNSGQYGQNINNFQGYPSQQPMMGGAVNGVIPGRTVPNTGVQKEKKDHSSLIKTILLVLTTITTLTFLGLFIYMSVQYNEAKVDVEGKIQLAKDETKEEVSAELEKEFSDREKYPYKIFTGPSDFGLLSFEYPKTWSLYVPDDGSQARDYHAYLNPGQVNVVDNKTVMALRVSIVNELTDSVKRKYTDKVAKGDMTVETKVVNNNNVDVYTGELDSKYIGKVCIFKIRDKTAIIQTDAMIFEDDFNRVLEKITFNM